MTSIGQMDRLISLHTATSTKQPSGAVKKDYSELAQVWAYAGHHGGAERKEADQNTNTANRSFIIWHRNDIDTTTRVVYQGQAYDITNIEEAEMPKGQFSRAGLLKLSCTLKDQQPQNISYA